VDGFAFALSNDGRFLYISETVSIYLGLSQVGLPHFSAPCFSSVLHNYQYLLHIYKRLIAVGTICNIKTKNNDPSVMSKLSAMSRCQNPLTLTRQVVCARIKGDVGNFTMNA